MQYAHVVAESYLHLVLTTNLSPCLKQNKSFVRKINSGNFITSSHPLEQNVLLHFIRLKNILTCGCLHHKTFTLRFLGMCYIFTTRAIDPTEEIYIYIWQNTWKTVFWQCPSTPRKPGGFLPGVSNLNELHNDCHHNSCKYLTNNSNNVQIIRTYSVVILNFLFFFNGLFILLVEKKFTTNLR